MKYVICLDTMGQDREITEEQKRFALETIERYIKIWEEEERVALAGDRDRRLKALEDVEGEGIGAADATLSQEVLADVEEYEFKEGEPDSEYFQKTFEKEEAEEEAPESKDGPVSKGKDAAPAKAEPKQPPAQVPVAEPVDDELREIETKYKTLKVIATKFLKEENWKDMIKNLLQYRVMRYPQII